MSSSTRPCTVPVMALCREELPGHSALDMICACQAKHGEAALVVQVLNGVRHLPRNEPAVCRPAKRRLSDQWSSRSLLVISFLTSFCHLCCRHWDNPKVLEKLSAAMGDAFSPSDLEGGVENGVTAGGETSVTEEEAGEEEPNVHAAASSGAPLSAQP